MDTVARIGGDEFVVLAPDVDSHLHAVDMGARLVAELCRRPAGEGERIAASVGIAVSVGGEGTAETLLNEADTAMYQAKSLGGGRAEVFDAALGRQVQQRAIAHRVLQSALDDRRVVVHYQPIIDLASGTRRRLRGARPDRRARRLDPAPRRLHPRRRGQRARRPARRAGPRDGLRGGAPLANRRTPERR